MQLPSLSDAWNVVKAWRSVPARKTYSRPLSLNLLITDRCNSKCQSCDIWKNGASGPDPLGIDFYRRIAGEFADLGTKRVALSGGEPLLRKDLEEIIQSFSDQGFHVQLTTHGLHADERRLKSLWDAGVHTLTFSLDHHTREGYKTIRGVDWLDRVAKHLELAVNTKPKGRVVETNTVISVFNIEQIPEIVEYALGLGVDGLNFSPVVESGESNLLQSPKEGLTPSAEAAEIVAKYLLKKKKKERRIRPSARFIQDIPRYFSQPTEIWFDCYAGLVSVDVYTNGDMRSCGSLPVFANLRERSLQDIWQSAEAEQQRRNMQERKCPGCYVSCKIEPSLLINPKTALPSALNRLLS